MLNHSAKTTKQSFAKQKNKMNRRKYQKKTKPALWLDLAKIQNEVEKSFPRLNKKDLSCLTNKPRKPVRRVSVKRAAENRQYTKLRKQYLLDYPFCMRCGKKSTEIHHWAGRRSNFLKTETWRSSCSDCNQFAKWEATAAIAEGWRAPIGVYLP
jgi:hypothetical protein